MKPDNKLIAEFMPNMMFPAESMMDMGIKQYLDDDGEYYLPEELQYDKSWDWLMPVVEEIDHLEYESERLDKIEIAIKTRQINAVHNAVVEFIKWYNYEKLTKNL